MSQLIESATQLVEHMMLHDRAEILDPLIRRLTKATQLMFRRQAKTVLAALRPAFRKSEAKQKATVKIPTAVGVAIASAMAGHSDAAWLKAHRKTSAAAFLGGATLVARQLDAEGHGQLRDAGDTAAESLKAIDKTTLERIHTKLEQGLAAELEDSEIVASVADDFKDFEDSRAASIAVSEIADAFGSGQTEAARAIALDSGDEIEKYWICEPDACETCTDNEDGSPIDLDEIFGSGDEDPPAHPNCRCTLEMRRKGEEEE